MKDLEDRTVRFSQNIIDLCRGIKENNYNKNSLSQLIRSATSIGANYHEADEASSNRDFINKLTIAVKEAKETKYWIRILAHTDQGKIKDLRKLWQEAQELNLILASIARNTKKK